MVIIKYQRGGRRMATLTLAFIVFLFIVFLMLWPFLIYSQLRQQTNCLKLMAGETKRIIECRKQAIGDKHETNDKRN